jgi:hypothetical protein
VATPGPSPSTDRARFSPVDCQALVGWWPAVVDYDRRPRRCGWRREGGNVGTAHCGLVPGLAAPRGGGKRPTSDAGKVAISHWQQRRAGQHESWPAIGACAKERQSISVQKLRSETLRYMES